MIVKCHKDEKGRPITAVCDSDILGKKFEEGNKQLDLTSDFYKGEEKSEEEVGDLMRNSYIVNVVGKNAVALAVKEGIVEKDNVMRISNVPYAQAVCVAED